MIDENRRSLCPSPRKLFQMLKSLEDAKEQIDVVSKLDLASKGWTSDDVQDMLDNGLGEEEFRYVCFIAMKFQHVELYSMLTKVEIAPYTLHEFDDEEIWRKFQDEIMSIGNPRIVTASLRFFRTGEEGFEHLWKPFIPLLLRLVEDQSVCDNIRELGSITRIVWNCSEANERPGNLTNLLLRTWRSFMDKMEDERSTCLEDNSVRLQRVELYHSALVSCGGKPFRNEEEWTEHAVRNLLIESLANGLASQINHKNPTRGFCRELGIDFAAFDKLL
eukprot:TRINITY_DN12954_c0_g1_i4.p1 TRINITY_DN12954_c0_g1~~TRINITY_DN12954_c0_g1_i4.p1  ORF type:complete len:276 (+),score=63.31 TRINITY_DN12954_c0_g1_i4:46-873(+)